MKILVLGDLHIHNHQAMGGTVVNGLNARCRDLLRSIRTVIEDNKPDAIVQLGDFFDTAKPIPAVYTAAFELIATTNVPWYILAGNHDISTLGSPSAVRPLAMLPNVTVFEQPTMFYIGSMSCIAVPYCSLDGKQAVKQAEEVLKGRHVNAAFLHYGLETVTHKGPDYVHFNCADGSYYGHEHTGYTACNAVSGPTNVGAFTDFRFSPDSSLRTNYYGGLLVSWTSSSTIERLLGPLFIHELPQDPYTIKSLCKVIHKYKGTSVYIKVSPDRLTFASKLKELGIVQDYAVQQVSELQDTEFADVDRAVFEKQDPLTSIAQVIADRLEVGALGEDEATDLIRLAKRELSL